MRLSTRAYARNGISIESLSLTHRVHWICAAAFYTCRCVRINFREITIPRAKLRDIELSSRRVIRNCYISKPRSLHRTKANRMKRSRLSKSLIDNGIFGVVRMMLIEWLLWRPNVGIHQITKVNWKCHCLSVNTELDHNKAIKRNIYLDDLSITHRYQHEITSSYYVLRLLRLVSYQAGGVHLKSTAIKVDG